MAGTLLFLKLQKKKHHKGQLKGIYTEQTKNRVVTVLMIVKCGLCRHLTKTTFPFFQTEVNFGKDIADNSWHFVVFTVDPEDNNEVQFYLDGDPAGNPQ